MSIRIKKEAKRYITIILTLLFMFVCIWPEQSVSASEGQAVSITSGTMNSLVLVDKVSADNKQYALDCSVDFDAYLNPDSSQNTDGTTEWLEIDFDTIDIQNLIGAIDVNQCSQSDCTVGENVQLTAIPDPTPSTIPSKYEIGQEVLELHTEMFKLKNQNRYLYIGGTTGDTQEFGIVAPVGAVVVESFSQDFELAKSEFIVRYGTSNPEIAGVTENGIISAAGEGEVLITAVIELRDGSSVILERTMVVSKAYMEFSEFTDQMSIGETSRFTIHLYGYEASELKWMTQRRDGVVVGKNFGKTSVTVRAVSAKDDVVYVEIGDITYQCKIHVTN